MENVAANPDTDAGTDTPLESHEGDAGKCRSMHHGTMGDEAMGVMSHVS